MAHILHLGKFYPPELGGIESVTYSLANGASQRNHSVSVLCFTTGDSSSAHSGSTTVIRTSEKTSIASQPLSFQYLTTGIHLSRTADIIHMHAPNMLAALICILAPSNVKIVVHWHSDVIGKGALFKLTRPLETALLRRADHIICTSDAYAKGSASIRPHIHKSSVVPIGVAPPKLDRNFDQVAASNSPLLRTIGTRPVVLCVGRLVPYKGYSVLIDAAKLMNEDAAIVIVGGGPLASSLRENIRAHGVEDRVILAGRLNEPSLQLLFSKAQIFCLPSVERSEAFGVVLIEAMSWGLPIVTTNIPGSGVPWVNSHLESGINVNPNEPQELASALDKLLSDETLRLRLAGGAHARFNAMFTEEQSVESVLNIYSKLLSK